MEDFSSKHPLFEIYAFGSWMLNRRIGPTNPNMWIFSPGSKFTLTLRMRGGNDNVNEQFQGKTPKSYQAVSPKL